MGSLHVPVYVLESGHEGTKLRVIRRRHLLRCIDLTLQRKQWWALLASALLASAANQRERGKEGCLHGWLRCWCRHDGLQWQPVEFLLQRLHLQKRPTGAHDMPWVIKCLPFHFAPRLRAHPYT